MQAIARVNRTAEGKTYGLVVDYWGDNRRITDALDLFSEEDGVLNALRPLSDKIQLLESRHRAAMRLFEGVDRAERRRYASRCWSPDDVRAEIRIGFSALREAMDMILPDPKALEDPYVSDLKWLARLRVTARRAHYQEPFDPKDYGAKVGADHHPASVDSKVSSNFWRTRDILDPAFKQHLDSLASAEAKAAEIEHAIHHEIHVHRDENPTAYASLWEQLEKIVNERREARVSAASALGRLRIWPPRYQGSGLAATGSGDGLTGTAGAILPFIDDAIAADARAGAATDVAKALEGYAVVVDWQHKEDVQRQMRRAIKERLRTLGMDASKIEAVTAKVMDVARARLAR